MNGTIVGEVEEGIGVRVTDNHGVEHEIELSYDGEIAYHGQDDYPDEPSERTNQEDESVSQARRFARYHVYREKGYDTIAPPDNPDRLAAVLLALLDLEPDEFDSHFGTLYKQIASHENADIEPPLDLPPEVYNEQFLLYKQGVYLEQELEAIQAAVDEPAVDAVGEERIDDFLQGWDSTGGGGLLSATHSILSGETDSSLSDLTIEGTSGVDTMYFEDTNVDRTIESENPFDGEPDAELELLPTETDRDVIRFYLGHNLICQIRDCFIGMGVEPPAQYRVLGHGKYKYTGKYRYFDFYPEYWDPEADVPGYTAPLGL